MLIRLNVIDREGKKTALDIEEGTTIRDAIEENLSTYNYRVCGANPMLIREVVEAVG